MRERREEDARATGQVNLPEEAGSKARERKIEGGDLVGTCSSFCCARRRTKSGLRSIETLPENWTWKEAGCRKDSSTLVGRMKVNVKLVARRKAQKAQASHCPEWYEARREISEAFRKVGARSENLKEEVEVAKRYCCASSQHKVSKATLPLTVLFLLPMESGGACGWSVPIGF